jgi:dihydrodipicolinate synthase/N-acetylneuraminate lyase
LTLVRVHDSFLVTTDLEPLEGIPMEFAPDRRAFVKTLAAGALALAFSKEARAAGKPLRGVFPIGQTPFTEDDKLDVECLQNQIRFCNKFKVHGIAWPQIASGWNTLSEQERLEGAEAILAAAKGGKAAIVIGVQALNNDLPKAVMYARHAAEHGADAVISLPPEKADDKAMIEYYKAIGAATELPLFVQSQGDMSVDLIVEMAKQIPTMKCVKDEAGNPLGRVTQIIERTNGKLAVFSGNGVRTMVDEMRLGFAGHCPYPVLSDFYAAAFDQWHAGKKREAFDTFGRIQAISSVTGATNYLMVVRGVFKETTRMRVQQGGGGGGRGGAAAGGGRGGRGGAPGLDEATKKAVREAWDEFMKPHVRG